MALEYNWLTPSDVQDYNRTALEKMKTTGVSGGESFTIDFFTDRLFTAPEIELIRNLSDNYFTITGFGQEVNEYNKGMYLTSDDPENRQYFEDEIYVMTGRYKAAVSGELKLGMVSPGIITTFFTALAFFIRSLAYLGISYAIFDYTVSDENVTVENTPGRGFVETVTDTVKKTVVWPLVLILLIVALVVGRKWV
jgi:hypothetical protein